jgi:hypothetical protein
MNQSSTLSKITELFSTEGSFESIEYIVKAARFIQKSLDLLDIENEIPETKFLEVAKKFYEKGIQVEGDLLFAQDIEAGFDSSDLSVKVNSFANASKI